MTKIRCFMLEPTTLVRESLRRFASPTEPGHYHDAEAVIVSSREQRADDSTRHDSLLDFDKSDPRWPTKCTCGYHFTAEDHHQLCVTPLYRGPDDTLYTLSEAPPGAMWFADWLDELGRVGPDGRVLVVALPPSGGLNDTWVVDQKSSNGNGWTRKGEPPNVTAQPSILTPRYHGWLRDGYLEEC